MERCGKPKLLKIMSRHSSHLPNSMSRSCHGFLPFFIGRVGQSSAWRSDPCADHQMCVRVCGSVVSRQRLICCGRKLRVPTTELPLLLLKFGIENSLALTVRPKQRRNLEARIPRLSTSSLSSEFLKGISQGRAAQEGDASPLAVRAPYWQASIVT